MIPKGLYNTIEIHKADLVDDLRFTNDPVRIAEIQDQLADTRDYEEILGMWYAN